MVVNVLVSRKVKIVLCSNWDSLVHIAMHIKLNRRRHSIIWKENTTLAPNRPVVILGLKISVQQRMNEHFKDKSGYFWKIQMGNNPINYYGNSESLAVLCNKAILPHCQCFSSKYNNEIYAIRSAMRSTLCRSMETPCIITNYIFLNISKNKNYSMFFLLQMTDKYLNSLDLAYLDI